MNRNHRFVAPNSDIKQWFVELSTRDVFAACVDIETSICGAGRMNESGHVTSALLVTGMNGTDKDIKSYCGWNVFDRTVGPISYQGGFILKILVLNDRHLLTGLRRLALARERL